MGKEIERKFLVTSDAWRPLVVQQRRYLQGYLSLDEKRVVRVRLIDNAAVLSIKGIITPAQRWEFEYPIPVEDAQTLLTHLCHQPLIRKIRYLVPFGGMRWEIDEFQGENEGLIIAEVELSREGQSILLPEWVGQEVTEDPRYLNVNLVKHPYRDW
ncbi:MAG: CYTH domain-containing protein [Calditrichaeota bacterium]|nr:MAG: CYTH domain-containing protein [Calditrichota bacterium]